MISGLLAPTYVFEGVRSILIYQTVSYDFILKALGLKALYVSWGIATFFGSTMLLGRVVTCHTQRKTAAYAAVCRLQKIHNLFNSSPDARDNFEALNQDF